MQRHRRNPFRLLLAATAVALAACASDAGDSSPSPTTNTSPSSVTALPASTTSPTTTPAPAVNTASPTTITATTEVSLPAPEPTMATPESSERLLEEAGVALAATSCEGLIVGPTAVCGTAAVPADWTEPDDAIIDIAYVLIPATAGVSTGTVIPFMGGPDESITVQIERLAPLSDAVPDSDLLIVDVRGAGRSGALTCAALDDATEVAVGAAQVSDTGICGEQIGPKRNNYTTVASVLDIESIRRELDLEAPSLIGFSYGTFMAQTYTTLFPNEVRGAVLDGAFPIEQTGWGTEIPTNIESVLELRCSRTNACPEGAAGVVASIRAIAESLAENPIDIPGAEQLLTEGAFASIVQFTAQNSEMGSFVEMMSAASDGDFSELTDVTAASLRRSLVGPTSNSPALYSAIACNDYAAPFAFDDTLSARRPDFDDRLNLLPNDEFGPFSKQGWVDSGWEEGDMCLEWPAPDIAPELRIPRGVKRPSVPVLVVNGDIDMQTSLAGARRVAAVYPNSVLLTVPNASHVALPVSPCAAEIEFAFLANPTLPSSNACLDQPVPE